MTTNIQDMRATVAECELRCPEAGPVLRALLAELANAQMLAVALAECECERDTALARCHAAETALKATRAINLTLAAATSRTVELPPDWTPAVDGRTFLHAKGRVFRSDNRQWQAWIDQGPHSRLYAGEYAHVIQAMVVVAPPPLATAPSR